ncbi:MULTISPECIES: phage tail protein I [Gilliamella]|uniref:Phage tail protein I n=1 Tax=Gilliamella apicola TaxID=1196095 RepID=A0A556S8K4_9GAMM|nr:MULTISPECIES: phage tail protein I [Gilliamella]MBI0030591.1 phage tail protein I [Gilliamella sp. B14384G15]MBI0057887.1 phage tail protein I [Gilliamella sp. B14384G12]MBI0096190.1 phage tail protein I [Gilliamella sp. W8136]TSJ97435.1 phage tail protein I [Gilliamella apicola]
MANKTLLPPTATKLEKNLSQAIACEPPIPLRSLWDPQTCPYELLPYLAWQYSVDRWDEEWSEQIKRKVIAEAFEIHKLKGTKEAIRRAVEPFGFLIKISEWWQNNQTPGSFTLEIGVSDTGITEEYYNELSRIIDDVKPVSRQLSNLAIQLVSKGSLTIGVSGYDGNTLAIYPYIAEKVITQSESHFGATIHLIDTMSIIP